MTCGKHQLLYKIDILYNKGEGMTIVGLSAVSGPEDLEGTCMVMIGATVASEFVSCTGSFLLYQMDKEHRA